MYLIIICKDGSTRRVQLSSNVSFDQKGNLLTNFKLHEKLQDTCIHLEGNNYGYYELIKE